MRRFMGLSAKIGNFQICHPQGSRLSNLMNVSFDYLITNDESRTQEHSREGILYSQYVILKRMEWIVDFLYILQLTLKNWPSLKDYRNKANHIK